MFYKKVMLLFHHILDFNMPLPPELFDSYYFDALAKSDYLACEKVTDALL